MKFDGTVWTIFLAGAIVFCQVTLATAQKVSIDSTSHSSAPGSAAGSGSAFAKSSNPPPSHQHSRFFHPVLQEGWHTPTWDVSPVGGPSLVGSFYAAQGSPHEMVQVQSRIEEHTNERVQSAPRIGEDY